MFKNKSIIANNIFILKDIFKRQFSLKKESPDFDTRIRLVYKDLKT